jgi:hypothetical protein
MTHPDIATLVDPLFAFGGKRVNKFNLSYPLCRLRKRGWSSEA